MGKNNKKAAKVKTAKVKAQKEAAEAAVGPVQSAEPAETVTVNNEKFNRTGFDMLMESQVPVAAVAADATVPAPEVISEKKTTSRINDGFVGMTRKMFRAGKNGQEILEANRDARIEKGYDPAHAMRRAKSDYGFIQREAKAEKGKAAASVEPVEPVAAAV